MRSSIRWLNAAAEPEAIQMPSVPNTSARHGGSPGTARNMPITAQNTSSAMTRGLVSWRYWDRCRVTAGLRRAWIDVARSRSGRALDEFVHGGIGVIGELRIVQPVVVVQVVVGEPCTQPGQARHFGTGKAQVVVAVEAEEQVGQLLR